jgi:hypothetical protein
MGQIGTPVRRYTIVPLEGPVSPTAEPVTPRQPRPLITRHPLPDRNRNRRTSAVDDGHEGQ